MVAENNDRLSNGCINPHAFDWMAANTKRAQDPRLQQWMADFLDENKVTKIVSFPGAHWCFEQSVARAFPAFNFEFIGIEQNPEVHTDMVEFAKVNSPLFPNAVFKPYKEHPCTTQEFLDDAQGDDCDVLYFDYLGTWSLEKQAHLDIVARKRVCKALFLTIMLNRGQPAVNEPIAKAMQLMKEAEGHIPYLHLINVDAPRQSLKPGSVSMIKIEGLPARVYELCQKHGVTPSLIGSSVYDSYPKIETTRMAPNAEMSLAFDLTTEE